MTFLTPFSYIPRREVALNGQHLKLITDHYGVVKLPELKGRFLDNGERLILPSKRVFFFVISDRIRACLKVD